MDNEYDKINELEMNSLTRKSDESHRFQDLEKSRFIRIK